MKMRDMPLSRGSYSNGGVAGLGGNDSADRKFESNTNYKNEYNHQQYDQILFEKAR